MSDVIDLTQRRKAKRRDRDYGTPHLTLKLWFDHEYQIECGQLEGVTSLAMDTGPEKHDVVNHIVLAASRTAAMLFEEGGPEAWKVEPVMVAMVTRDGFMTSRPHRFWHDEAGAAWQQRVRCACWALRQAWKVAKPLLSGAWQLVFQPGKLKALEIE